MLMKIQLLKPSKCSRKPTIGTYTNRGKQQKTINSQEIRKLYQILKCMFYHNFYLSRNLIGSFDVVDKSPDNSARVNLSRNAFFSSRFEKNLFFDVDIVVKNKSKCVLARSVLLSRTICVNTVVKMLRTHEVQPSESTTNFDHCDDAYRCR